ncbi:VOC family protein [Micromonospora sp. NBC_00898]|uniref:VOC family protein n=1 Tax=Micromonospora sp. NBC_00898 TaxID=2975981 RepID=UPI0038677E92|nr:VOC family protein [Micromonospora sp. NBC_00898]
MGYVVTDIERAMDHWVNVLGVGPFFFTPRLTLHDFRYRGCPSSPEASVALAQSGDLQIELIQQNNSAPSAFREFLDTYGEGLHHVAYWTERFDSDLDRLRGACGEVMQTGRSGSGGPDERFVYLTAAGQPGAVIELSEVSGTKGALFRGIAAAAVDWDGRDPIREMSTALDHARHVGDQRSGAERIGGGH